MNGKNLNFSNKLPYVTMFILLNIAIWGSLTFASTFVIEMYKSNGRDVSWVHDLYWLFIITINLVFIIAFIYNRDYNKKEDSC